VVLSMYTAFLSGGDGWGWSGLADCKGRVVRRQQEDQVLCGHDLDLRGLDAAAPSCVRGASDTLCWSRAAVARHSGYSEHL
jgi:hypothetical protein